MCMLQVKFVLWLILIEPRLVLIFFVSSPQDTKKIEDQSSEFKGPVYMEWGTPV